MNTIEENHEGSASEGKYPENWYKPGPEVLARPTYWPMVLSVGITLLAWGAVTSLYISALGLIISIAALANWIGDIRREQQHESQQQQH